MKNYKIWASLIFLVVIIVLIITNVIDISSSKDEMPEKMIAALGCTTCHGADLAGTIKGPSILNLKRYWVKEDLVKYLKNPTSFFDSPRFLKYQDQYKPYIMPSYDTVNVETLRMVSDYILNK